MKAFCLHGCLYLSLVSAVNICYPHQDNLAIDVYRERKGLGESMSGGELLELQLFETQLLNFFWPFQAVFTYEMVNNFICRTCSWPNLTFPNLTQPNLTPNLTAVHVHLN